MYIYEIQTAYIFPKGLRLNDIKNKVIKLIEIGLYCYRGYFLNTYMYSIKFKKLQLAEWCRICSTIQGTRVHVMGMSLILAIGLFL